MRPVPIGIDPTIRAYLNELHEAVRGILVPNAPMRMWSVASTSLPPASGWTDCAVIVSDLDVIAVSNGTNWIRQDTGAAI